MKKKKSSNQDVVAVVSPSIRLKKLSNAGSAKFSASLSTNLHSPLCRLSINIHGVIFRFLTPREIVLVAHTCHALRLGAEQEHVWVEHVGGECRDLPPDSRPMLQCLHQRAILANYYKPKFVTYQLRGHSAEITAVDMRNDLILTGSSDRSARLWNVKTKKAAVLPHAGEVLCAIFAQKKAVTCSSDRTIKVWSLSRPGSTIPLCSPYRLQPNTEGPHGGCYKLEADPCNSCAGRRVHGHDGAVLARFCSHCDRSLRRLRCTHAAALSLGVVPDPVPGCHR